MNKTRTILASIAVGAVIGAGITGIGIARADTLDSDFVNLLAQHNIAPNSDGISWAHQICAHLDAGSTPIEEAQKVYAQTNSSMDIDKSKWFTAAAIVVYCPWHENNNHTTAV